MSSRGSHTAYPESRTDRTRWIEHLRPAREAVDPAVPRGFFVEEERDETGRIASVATVFLTNRECPWRCLMCDLWKHTTEHPLPAGAITAQIDYALTRLPPSHQIKLYNSGSFFDPRAIPREEHPAIAQRLRPFSRVILECHPALVGDSVERFRDLLSAPLEIAMGLETVHEEVLAKLNKGMTLRQFARAAAFLRRSGVAVRAFVLVKPPFLDEAAALDWACRSVEFAFDCGAGVVALIPTRFGNGALEALAAAGQFSPPRLQTLEQALEHGVKLGRGRVFADLWDLKEFAPCSACFGARQERLKQMNETQSLKERVRCSLCEG